MLLVCHDEKYLLYTIFFAKQWRQYLNKLSVVAAVEIRANTYTVISVCLHTPEHCRYDLSKLGVHGRGKSGYYSVKKKDWEPLTQVFSHSSESAVTLMQR